MTHGLPEYVATAQFFVINKVCPLCETNQGRLREEKDENRRGHHVFALVFFLLSAFGLLMHPQHTQTSTLWGLISCVTLFLLGGGILRSALF